MFDRLAEIRVPKERREAIEAILDGPHFLSDVLDIRSGALQTEVREVLCGIKRTGRVAEFRYDLMSPRRYRLRTVDGQPLGPWRTGLVEGTSVELDYRERLGLSLDRTIDLGAVIECDAHLGLTLLDRAGWGIVVPRHYRRNAAVMGVTDARGKPVGPYDRWRVVEVGSAYEQRAREAGDLVEPLPVDGDADEQDERDGRPKRGRPRKDAQPRSDAATEA